MGTATAARLFGHAEDLRRMEKEISETIRLASAAERKALNADAPVCEVDLIACADACQRVAETLMQKEAA
jgi:hypothetical protein